MYFIHVLHTAPYLCQPDRLATLSFSAILIVCDRDKNIHIAQQILEEAKMDGMVGPSSSGYQGVSQIWAISTGGETYRGERCQACLGECTFLWRLSFPVAQQIGIKNDWEKSLIICIVTLLILDLER